MSEESEIPFTLIVERYERRSLESRRRSADVLVGCGSHRDDSQTLQAIEVSTVVREESEVVAKSGGANQEVKITDGRTGGSQSATLSGENAARCFIDWQYLHDMEEPRERAGACFWIAGVVNPFI